MSELMVGTDMVGFEKVLVMA